MLEGMGDDDAQRLVDDAFERLTMAYQRAGDLAAASDVITEWQTQTKRDEGKVLALIQQSRVLSFQGEFEQAIQVADQADEMAQTAGYDFGLGMAKRVRADMMWKLGHTDDALKLAQSALAILEKSGELEQQAATHVTLAAANHSSGQFYRAIQHLRRAALIVEQLGRQFELAIIYSNLGETYAELYAMDKALEAHQKAIALVGLERAHPDLIRNLGVDLVAVGRQQEGSEHLQLALERARAIKDPDLVAQVLYSLADMERQTGDLDQAEARGKEILDIATKSDSLRHTIRAWMLLGAVAQQRGDQSRAQSLFNECSMAAQRTADRHTIWRTHAALHLLFQESMPQMADIHRRIAAEMMTNILNSIEDPALRETFRNAEPVQSVLGTET